MLNGVQSQWPTVGGAVLGGSLVRFGLVPSAAATMQAYTTAVSSGTGSSKPLPHPGGVTEFVAQHPVVATALGGAAGGAIAYVAQSYFSRK